MLVIVIQQEARFLQSDQQRHDVYFVNSPRKPHLRRHQTNARAPRPAPEQCACRTIVGTAFGGPLA